MSALCGRIQWDGQPLEAATLAPTMAALEGYGPDGAGLWCEGTSALGHQMLHITPESLGETLPWQDELTGLAITADARLDNREELLAIFDIPALVGREVSDAQLILRAYQKWGDRCPQHLLGDFAFALWDSRQRQLFCVRDIFGVRPFYYYNAAQWVVFASDLNALRVTPGVPNRLNEPLVAAFLDAYDLTFAKKSQTFFEGIYKLPPAHSLTFTSTGQRLQRYWSPDHVAPVRYRSETDYIEHLRQLLDQAVTCRLRSAFPIGTHLSGGLDSSSVAVLAARSLRSEGKSLQGFSWSPPLTVPMESEEDERSLVKEMCEWEQITCHYVSLTGQDLLNHRDRSFLTQPTEMLQFEQKVQADVARRGIRVMLSGWGGDEAITFNGRGYFAKLFVQGRWATLYRELTLRGQLYGLGLKGQLLQKVIAPLLPDALLPLLATRLDETVATSVASAYMNPQFAQRIRPQIDQLPHLAGLLRERTGVRTNQLMLLEDGHLTERIEDWALSGARQGFVYSYPLLDQRIVEFALGVPVELFFKQGWKRYLFRTATEGILPDPVRWHKSKLEVASFGQLRQCSTEIRPAWKAKSLKQLQAYRHSEQLAQWINLDKLEQALSDAEPLLPGAGPAALLINAYADAELTASAQDCKLTSVV